VQRTGSSSCNRQFLGAYSALCDRARQCVRCHSTAV
jgi:hypothetical protein